jgi:hypothetical protein
MGSPMIISGYMLLQSLPVERRTKNVNPRCGAL